VNRKELLERIDKMRFHMWKHGLPYNEQVDTDLRVIEKAIKELDEQQAVSGDALEYMKAIKLMHKDMDAKIKTLHGNFNHLCEGMQEAARDFSEAMKQLKDIPEMKQLEKDMRAFMEVIKKHFVKPAAFSAADSFRKNCNGCKFEAVRTNREHCTHCREHNRCFFTPAETTGATAPKPEKKTGTGRHKHKPLGTSDDAMLDAVRKAGGSIVKAAKMLNLSPPSIYSRMRYNKLFGEKVKAIQTELNYDPKAASKTSQAKPGEEPSEQAKQKNVRTAAFPKKESSDLRNRIIDACDKFSGVKPMIAQHCGIKLQSLEIMLMRDSELKEIFDEYYD